MNAKPATSELRQRPPVAIEMPPAARRAKLSIKITSVWHFTSLPRTVRVLGMAGTRSPLDAFPIHQIYRRPRLGVGKTKVQKYMH